MKTVIISAIIAVSLAILFSSHGANALNCSPPANGDWNITANCTLASNATATGHVRVQNNSVLTIPNTFTLGIAPNMYLKVEYGSGVLIQVGGKITVESKTDRFGVQKLYPTRLGGTTWTENWDNGHPRILLLNNTADKQYDPWVHATGYSYPISTSGNLTILGNGVAKLMARSHPTDTSRPSQPRIYVYDPTNSSASYWRDVEVTIYGMRVSEDANDSGSAGFQLARGYHHDDINRTCVHTYYSRMNYGVVNGSGYPTNLNVNNFKKELNFTSSSNGTTNGRPSGNNNFTNTALPKDQWFGHKFIYQHYNNGTWVHLEMWVDKSSNGTSGGTWQKVISANDNSTKPWSVTSPCTKDPNPNSSYVIIESVPDIFTRNTGITEADYKFFSIREINPLP